MHLPHVSYWSAMNTPSSIISNSQWQRLTWPVKYRVTSVTSPLVSSRVVSGLVSFGIYWMRQSRRACQILLERSNDRSIGTHETNDKYHSCNDGWCNQHSVCGNNEEVALIEFQVGSIIKVVNRSRMHSIKTLVASSVKCSRAFIGLNLGRYCWIWKK